MPSLSFKVRSGQLVAINGSASITIQAGATRRIFDLMDGDTVQMAWDGDFEVKSQEAK